MTFDINSRCVEKIENACSNYWYDSARRVKGVSLLECLSIIEEAYGAQYVPMARKFIVETILELPSEQY